MEISAIYHRPDSEMAYLVNEDLFQIRLKTKHNDLKKVELLYGDPYGTKVNEKDQSEWAHDVLAMERKFQSEYHDYWIANIKVPTNRLQYAFHLVGNDDSEYLYDDRKVVKYTDEAIQKLTCFRMPYLHQIDRIKTPDWVKKTVLYQIFPERFANGDPQNDPQGTLPWGSVAPTRENFFGGDLRGITQKLDYLKDLGINGIYLCPIFTASSNHKYDTIDYFNIDPSFGTKEDFKELVDQAHARGMRVMLDAVFNHMGDFSMQWQDVVKNGEKSRFADWFHIKKFPVSYKKTTNNEFATDITYEVFANTPHMPKINTANPEVIDYLLNIATYWIKQFDIDAWRLDVANEIDHHFWQKFYQATHAIKPDFYVVGEVWHSAQEWVGHDEFDAAMNYPYTESLIQGTVSQEITLKEMVSMLNEQLMLYRDQTNQVMLNSLDTHDTVRLLRLCRENKDLARQALALMFLQPGSPCIYYGTEVGMTGGFDPDNRRCMIWDSTKQDQKMYQFIQKLIAFRRENSPLLSKGEIRWLKVDDVHKVIEIERQLNGQNVKGIFNFGQDRIAVDRVASPILNQNFEGSHLQPQGLIIYKN